MPIFEVKVPQLSESVAEATLLQWKKKAGDSVAQDEILIEIETDKVVLEVPAPSAGVLSEIIIADGGTVGSDQVIAKIDSDGKGVTATATSAAPTAPVAAPVVAVAPVAASNSAAGIAMPAAAKILAEKNISAADVAGTGRDGRVTKADAISATPAVAKTIAPAAPKLAALPTNIPLGDRPEERVPMSRLRARIAERLLESQATNAILTTFNEVNMAPVMNMRNKYKEIFEKEHGVKLGFMSFFVKAAVHALKKYPV
jgi:2-oxoglutarate dehydrogenase E2 component (dihydrolipoamide succinyltransferase)